MSVFLSRVAPGIILFLFLPPLFFCGEPVQSSNLSKSSAYVESLLGEWEYRKGFEPDWLKNPAPGPWKKIVLPVRDFQNHETNPELKGYSGQITLRYPLSERLILMLKNKIPLGFNSGELSDVSAFYLEHVLLGKLGSRKPYSSGFNLQLVTVVPPEAYELPDPRYLYVSLYSDDGFTFYMRGPRIELGRADLVEDKFIQDIIISTLLIVIYFAVGMYHLLLGFRRPKDLYNFYFGIMAVGISFFFLSNSALGLIIFGDNVMARSRVDQVSLMFLGPSFTLFLSQFFYNRHSRVGLAWAGLCAVMGLVDAFASYHVMRTLLDVWMLSALIIVPYLLYLIIKAIREKKRGAYTLIGGVLFVVGGMVYDILIETGVIKGFGGIFVSNYTFLIFIMSIAVLLANRFVRVNNEAEELNEKLEIKVRERTDQLQNTLNDVQELKDKQDGDYFLTSQLIKPLAGNQSVNKGLRVELLTLQRKRFTFRKWESDLGGDLSAVHDIRLRDRDYVVFLNSDAMGKSMQGAGGALVIGTVFKSLVARFELEEVGAGLDLHPEEWLEECILELQNVFVGFDGSMLISIVLGLIDEKAGVLYYVNAEHPLVVLYRDRQARFIEDSMSMRKIGVQDAEKNLRIKIFKLEQDDVIFAGSDGRDDLRLGIDEQGNSIINEDEKQFLRIVEESQGHLDLVEQSISKSGQIMDDLSLIRLGYHEDFPLKPDGLDEPGRKKMKEGMKAYRDNNRVEALPLLEEIFEKNKNIAEVSKALFAIHFQNKNYDSAVRAGEAYLDINPADSESLFILSLCYTGIADYANAASCGERYRLRSPQEIKNLVNLGDIYRRMGNKNRARRLLEMARELEPEHKLVLKLSDRLHVS